MAVLVAGMAGLAVVAGGFTVDAQIIPLPFGSTTTTAQPPLETTTTTAPPSTTTTREARLLLPPRSTTTTTTTTTAPPAAPRPAPAKPDERAEPAANPETGDGGAAPADAGGFPAHLRALMDSVPRTASNNTKGLLFALSPLLEHGMSETDAAIVGFGRFPVAGLASYSHDWWFPRFGPGWRLHMGTDIFASHGTPVRAPVDGTVRVTNGGLGGLSVYVVQPDGTYWYLAHLSAVPEGLATGQQVTTGQVVGFVGDSGNARGGPPHVHLEIHPGGGGAIDPKPVLDQFIADAEALAPRVVEAYAATAQPDTPPAQVALPAPAPQPVAAALPPRAALLWTTAVSPTGGALHLAEAEAVRVASSIDWSTRADDDGLTEFERRLAWRYAARWLQPLVHPVLARHLAD